MKDLLTIVILAYNEEDNIATCIKSCAHIATKVLVLDNNSEDDTVGIAERLGAEVIQSDLRARGRIDWVLTEGKITTKWVLFLDADERMTPASAEEFKSLCEKYANDEKVNGIVVKYRLCFMGKELRHGGFSPLNKLRAFKPGTAYYEKLDVDEHYVLTSGSMVYMRNYFRHEDYKGLKQWVDKHASYAQRAALDYEKKLLKGEAVNYEGLELGAKLKRMLKYKMYYKLPPGFRAHLFYIYCCYIRLGFLDGREGRAFAYLHSYWYRYLVDLFIYENSKLDKSGKERDSISWK